MVQGERKEESRTREDREPKMTANDMIYDIDERYNHNTPLCLLYIFNPFHQKKRRVSLLNFSLVSFEKNGLDGLLFFS